MPPRFDASKPLTELCAVAVSLGWHGLEMWQHLCDDGQLLTWYSTSDPKFFLQINEHPMGRIETYAAAVYADRYGICTGWHRFCLDNSKEIAALRPWLSRRQFKVPQWRRSFQARHPECCLARPTPQRCITKKVSGDWPPYLPDDPKPSA